MKKVIGIFMVMVMAFIIITANAEQCEIFEKVYGFWKELNEDFVKMCDDYYLGSSDYGFIKDGIYYAIGYELGYGEESKNLERYEVEKRTEEVWKEHGVEHAKCSIEQIGRGNTMDVCYCKIMTATNLRNVEDFNFDYLNYDDGSDVYGVVFVYYEHVY